MKSLRRGERIVELLRGIQGRLWTIPNRGKSGLFSYLLAIV